MPKVHFVNEMVTVEVPAGTALREVAIAQGVELYRGMWTHLNCRGNGLCGRCRVWMLSSGASAPSLRERVRRVIRGNLRLACQVRVMDDLEVRTRPLGSATAQAVSPVPSYREEALKRLQEARETEKKEAEKKAAAEKAAAQKKAADEKAAAEKAAAEEAAAAEKAEPGAPAQPAAGSPPQEPTAEGGSSTGTSS